MYGYGWSASIIDNTKIKHTRRSLTKLETSDHHSHQLPHVGYVTHPV
ncbi:hypothetical protein RSAG8_13967, partial [Rhizoctonia solani AG-8 WAC10335]